jgi:hypothetical protein
VSTSGWLLRRINPAPLMILLSAVVGVFRGKVPVVVGEGREAISAALVELRGLR